MKKYDVAVVGGGPIGGYVSKNIAESGFQVTLYEEHKKIGMPLKCAGLVSSRVLDFLNTSEKEIVQNEIYGAHIYSPSGKILTIGGDKIHAFVINRPKFDEDIINEATDKGAEIHLESKAIFAKREDNHIKLKISQKEKTSQIKCSLLIGADGPHSTIRSAFRFPRPTEILRGIGAEVTNTNLDPKFVEIFLGCNIAPGFFAWIIPVNKEGSEARVGLCVNEHSKKSLTQCFTNLLRTKQLKNITIKRRIGGSIPLGPLTKTFQSNVMLVGDAAAQVKPTSGGGLYPGMLCAHHCSAVAVEALNANDFSSRFLKKYHMLWSKKIGRELSLGMNFRAIFKNLQDKQIDKYIEELNEEKIIETICKYGDIDFPSNLVFPLIKKKPSLLKLIPSAIIN